MKKYFGKLCWGRVLLSLPLLFASCGNGDNALEEIINGGGSGGGSTAVTEITIDLASLDAKYLNDEKTQLKLKVGDEVTLSFTILPEEMASTEVELTAADATILSIDGLKVKALKEGETKVTAKAGEKTAECTVTVKAAENKSNVVTLTTTVGFDASAGTRALTFDGTKRVKTFAVDDQIAVVYKKTGGATAVAVSEKLTSTDIASGSKSATFTVTLDDPDKTEKVTYIYPAAMAKADGSVNYDALATQDGTLATLGSKLDYCTESGAWNADNLPTLTLENQLAILALTLTDSNGANEITGNVTGVTVKAGEDTYTVTRTAAAGPIYVAIKPIASKNVVVTTTGGSKNYVKLLTEKTYASGNGYSVSWGMTPIIPFTEATANDVGRVIAIDGKVYDNTTIATAVGATAVAIISYVGIPGDAGVGWYRGLAIGLSDYTGGRVVWKDAAMVAEDNNGTVVPAGTSGWFLPSVAQLEKVCQGLATKKKGTAVTTELSTVANDNYTASNLNSIITGAGGTGFLDRAYCTSTASNETSAWYFGFRTGMLNEKPKTDVGDVRSVIAF